MALRFPIVVKPRFAYQWRRKGLWEKVGAAKAIIISSADELRREYLRVSEVTPEILLQEYVAGDDCDIVVCCCYINRRSELLGYFTGRKLKQSPPYVGTGSIVEATEVSAILAPAVELLKSFGYAGLAEVEFKYDKSADRYALIEVNPRHWDQHELGTLVGVNMSWIAYSDLVGRSIAPVKPVYAPGRQYKWIAERELIDAVVRSLRSEVKTTRASRGWLRGSYAALKKVLPDVVRLLRGSKMFGILRIGDPLPAMQLGLALVAAAWGLLIAAGRPSKLRYRARAIGEGDRRL
jgi:predicted ATP-grasp superfamily ATP-dependent carboligase